ncbi:MAG: carbon-nitrogen hydrolase family protein [Gammaproteobacteria bacterium]|nr:carbon-nitrogen hydrolase family protein [Gammaproteobacteria bacterium]
MTTTKTRLAAIQLTSVAATAGNMRVARRLIESAAQQGAALAVLPENFAFMAASESARVAIAEPDGHGPIQDCLAATARDCGLWVVGGTIPITSDDPQRPFAACCVWDHEGRRVGRYDKIHLFDVRVPGSAEAYHESHRTMAGSTPLVIQAPFGNLGVAVCYDLRFPELFRSMLLEHEVNVIALPAAFTQRTGQAHWHTLLKARAIENLAYVVAAAQSGEHPGGRLTYGHSMVVGPWGEVLAEAADGAGVVTATMDVDYLQQLRVQFPALSHRRLQTPAMAS